MLRKGVNPYEHMDDWKKFNETSLPEKEGFYSPLNIEDITDADYVQTFWNKKFRTTFFVQGNTLFLADVFENSWNMCLEIYELDPA